MPKLRRWASNWLRVVLCILDFRGAALVSPHRRLHGLRWTSPRPIPDLPWTLYHHMDFDSTMGYPGEGPFWVLSTLPRTLLLVLPRPSLSGLVLSG